MSVQLRQPDPLSRARIAVHDLVNALFDLVGDDGLGVPKLDQLAALKPWGDQVGVPVVVPPARPVPVADVAPKPATAVHKATDKPEDMVRMSVCKTGKGRLQIIVSLSPVVTGRLGVDRGDAVFVSPVNRVGQIEIRKCKGRESGHKLVKYAGSSRLVVLLTSKEWGMTATHPSTACVHELDLEASRLKVVVPTWFKPAAAPAPPAARPPVGDELSIMCHTCGEADGTLECKRCEEVFCPSCWKLHARAHLAGTV